MIFDDRTYSVLIVSSSEKFSDAIVPLLPEYKCTPIKKAASMAAAKRDILEKRYDLVIVNSPVADDSGMTFAADVSAQKNSICLVAVKAELFEEASWRLNEHGVFSISKPAPASSMRQVFRYMITARERLRVNEAKSVSLEDKMKEIKIVNRAIWLLIEHLKMTENDAQHYVEKQAMNTGATKLEIAEKIISTYSN